MNGRLFRRASRPAGVARASGSKDSERTCSRLHAKEERARLDSTGLGGRHTGQADRACQAAAAETAATKARGPDLVHSVDKIAPTAVRRSRIEAVKQRPTPIPLGEHRSRPHPARGSAKHKKCKNDGRARGSTGWAAVGQVEPQANQVQSRSLLNLLRIKTKSVLAGCEQTSCFAPKQLHPSQPSFTSERKNPQVRCLKSSKTLQNC